MNEREIIVVYGALRSGTTLLKLLLDMHSDVENPGEFDFLVDCLSQRPDGGINVNTDRLGQSRIMVDSGLILKDGLTGEALVRDLAEQVRANSKKPIVAINLHRKAWAINFLFPGARIVHLKRDPRDVARSSIGMGWVGLAYFGVDHWIQTERAWDEAVADIPPERRFELSYETLVRKPEETLSDICAFLSVEYQPVMLRFHENSTYQPIDGVLAEQWRRKAATWEIAQIEAKLGDYLGQKGFEPSGGPKMRIGPLQDRMLSLRNKTATIRMSVKKYGLPLYFKLKLRQVLGLDQWLRGAVLQQWEIDRRNLR